MRQVGLGVLQMAHRRSQLHNKLTPVSPFLLHRVHWDEWELEL